MDNLDNIIKYIEYESGISKSKTMLSFLFMMLLVGIPTSLWGVHAELTKYLFLPPIAIFCVWTIYLMFKTDYRKQYALYLGLSSIFLSILYAVAAYKVKFGFMQVETKDIVIFTIAYVLINLVVFINTKRKIEKGNNNKLEKSKKIMEISGAMSLIGLSIGKSFRGSGNDVAVPALVTCLLILSIIYSIGMGSLLRYYYICKLNRIQTYHQG